MSKYLKNPGELDIDFGIDGYARLPVPKDALSSGSVYSTTTDSANRIIWAAGAPVDGEDYYFLARLDANGIWEPDPGFVPIEDPALDPSLSFAQEFNFITPATDAPDSNYITYSKCTMFTGEDWLWQAAVGHYRNNFAPLDGFGVKGLILVRPDSQPIATPTSTAKPEDRPKAKPANEAKIPQKLKNRYKEEVYAPATRSVLLGNTIKTLYASSLNGQPNSQRLWVALHDAETGVPVTGLGPDGSQSQWLIQNFFGNTFEPTGCHFFNDGGFALAGKEGAPGIVARYKSNGELDTDFNQTGFIELANRSIQLGADERRIIICQGTYFTSAPGRAINLTIRAYDKQTGLPDTQFNENGVLSINIDPGSDIRAYATNSIIIATDGSIYVAGNLLHADEFEFYQQGIIHKVTQDGRLDTKFASEGRFLAPTDRVNALRGAYLGSDGLRFISQLNEDGYAAMKLFI